MKISLAAPLGFFIEQLTVLTLVQNETFCILKRFGYDLLHLYCTKIVIHVPSL